MSIKNNFEIESNLYAFIINWIQEQGKSDPTPREIARQCQIFFTKQDLLLPEKKQIQLVEYMKFSVLGLGPLENFLQDEDVTEIMVNGPKKIFIEKKGKIIQTPFVFFDEKHLRKVINQIVGQIGRRIDEKTPLVDARLQDGSRVNAIIAPLSLTGSTLTIRKFNKKVFTTDDLVKSKTLTSEMAKFLQQAVQSKKNIVVSGGTGAGKTSTLNFCATLIDHAERIITIEDSAEIKIDHPNCVSLESRHENIEGSGEITIRMLLKNALRMRPDRIVVGEIRGGEAIDMLQAMNTGHKGSLTTVHANAPLESLFRIETMVLMGDVDLPISAIRPQVIQGIDVIIQQERLHTGERKITSIAMVDKTEFSRYAVTEIFSYDKKKQEFICHITAQGRKTLLQSTS